MGLSRSVIVALAVTTLVGAVFACGSSSGGGTGVTGCVALSACCATLTGSIAEACNLEASSAGATAATCESALSGYQSAGECGGSTATGCSALSACCPNLPASQDPTECDAVVSGGTSSACQLSLSMYQAAGYCGTSGGSLPTCKNPPALMSTCDACISSSCGSYVSEVESACSAFLACYVACDCSDTTCLTACLTQETPACKTASAADTCSTTGGPCVSACTTSITLDAGTGIGTQNCSTTGCPAGQTCVLKDGIAACLSGFDAG